MLRRLQKYKALKSNCKIQGEIWSPADYVSEFLGSNGVAFSALGFVQYMLNKLFQIFCGECICATKLEDHIFNIWGCD